MILEIQQLDLLYLLKNNILKLLIITQKVGQEDQLLGFFLDWIREFSVHFKKVTVLCLEKGQFSLPQNVEVRSLGKDQGSRKFIQFFRFYKEIIGLSSEYDAVFVHMNPIWVCLGFGFWKLAGKKVCMWYAHKSVTRKLKLAEKFSDVIFTSTPEGFRFPSRKLVITGQGINVNLFNQDGSHVIDPEGIVSVGRIAPIKNYEILIETVNILKERGMTPRVSIIGEPALRSDFEYQEKLKSMVKRMNLEKNVSFLGKVRNHDLPPYYQKNKLYINLSDTGSLDKTILEAIASGCVVLSSNDSAKSFLPSRLIINDIHPQKLAQQIKEAFHLNYGNELRQYVVDNHSVSKLIRTISDSIKA